jgi:hypothetical protein
MQALLQSTSTPRNHISVVVPGRLALSGVDCTYRSHDLLPFTHILSILDYDHATMAMIGKKKLYMHCGGAHDCRYEFRI